MNDEDEDEAAHRKASFKSFNLMQGNQVEINNSDRNTDADGEQQHSGVH